MNKRIILGKVVLYVLVYHLICFISLKLCHFPPSGYYNLLASIPMTIIVSGMIYGYLTLKEIMLNILNVHNNRRYHDEKNNRDNMSA